MPDWQVESDGATPLTEVIEPSAEVLLHAERQMVEWLAESMRDLEILYREDFGWRKLGIEAEVSFTAEGRRKIAETSRIMAVANPLIKRGLILRTGYIWGQGVNVSIMDDGAKGQDVGQPWRRFWNDPINRSVLSSPEAQADLERQLGTEGEVFFAMPTDPVTGEVNVRSIPTDEIVDIICDPDDEATVWLYKRSWSVTKIDKDGQATTEKQITYYPRLGWRPAARMASWGGRRNGHPIRWDAPIRHVAVNKIKSGARQRGMGDVFAALPWARMDKEFLENWAIYMKAMARILWQYTAKGARGKRIAQAMAKPPEPTPGNPDGVAETIIGDPSVELSAVSKSGAQIDAESHKPLASYVAAALGVPLTMLIADPGSTGARAVAETLDTPLRNEASMRRQLWTGVLTDLGDYVIDSAVLAPANQLRGTAKRVGDRIEVSLPPGDQRDVEVVWPELDDLPMDVFMKAISLADTTQKMPGVWLVRLMCKALKIDDVDEVIGMVTDDQGNFIPPEVADQEAINRAVDQGRV